MCYPCTHCNKCGKFPPCGTCINCGYVNKVGALRCAHCGAAFPPPPGVSQKDGQLKETESA